MLLITGLGPVMTLFTLPLENLQVLLPWLVSRRPAVTTATASRYQVPEGTGV
jgi:hypothetical protein